MTLAETLGLSDDRERLLVRALQAGLVVTAVYALVMGYLGLAVEGLLALGVTLVPALVRREYSYHMDAGLVLWITLATVLHVVGSTGVYQQYQWYDEIAHLVSSVVVAGLGYATLRALELHSEDVDFPPEVRGVFVVVFVVAFGVVWEVFEFGAVAVSSMLGVESPVTVFGVDDIVTDFLANTTGGVLVALWGSGYLRGLTAFFRRRFAAGDRNDPQR